MTFVSSAGDQGFQGCASRWRTACTARALCPLTTQHELRCRVVLPRPCLATLQATSCIAATAASLRGAGFVGCCGPCCLLTPVCVCVCLQVRPAPHSNLSKKAPAWHHTVLFSGSKWLGAALLLRLCVWRAADFGCCFVLLVLLCTAWVMPACLGCLGHARWLHGCMQARMLRACGYAAAWPRKESADSTHTTTRLMLHPTQHMHY